MDHAVVPRCVLGKRKRFPHHPPDPLAQGVVPALHVRGLAGLLADAQVLGFGKDAGDGGIWDRGLQAFRAIRFVPPYRNPQFLNPLPTDDQTESLGINNARNVLGLSYNSNNYSITHIGIWDRKGQFKSYYEGEGTSALFNDSNLIVLSQGGLQSSYILPKPGVKLDLMDFWLTTPAEAASKGELKAVYDINNRGDMVGNSYDGINFYPFSLQRVFPED